MTQLNSIGLIGARGYTGAALLQLIAQHPNLRLAFASSRAEAGAPLPANNGAFDGRVFENLSAEEITKPKPDIYILALPDGAGAPYLQSIEKQCPNSLIIDLSADHRFDDSWAYGLPELYAQREKIASAKRIANPGCYATAAQLAIFPVRKMLSAAPSIFGVSGYSGAGTRPSRRNDKEALADNLMPYALTGHKHEKEITHQLSHKVRFTPHVHSAFSGLLVTVHLSLTRSQDSASLLQLYEKAYKDCSLVTVQSELLELGDGSGHRGARIGGFSIAENGRDIVVLAALDNLLKGAAVQAIQNMNLALGLNQYTAIIR
ncbi:MAG: N-acetyl-gamma-glutamyl-phosphate reductase [bacterium]